MRKSVFVFLVFVLPIFIAGAQLAGTPGSFTELATQASNDTLSPMIVFDAQYELRDQVLTVNTLNDDAVSYARPITGSLELWDAEERNFESVRFSAPALNNFRYDILDGTVAWAPFKEDDYLVRTVPTDISRWRDQRFVWLEPSNGGTPSDVYRWTVPKKSVQDYPPPEGYKWVQNGVFRNVPDGYDWYVPNKWISERWVRMALMYHLTISNETLEEYGGLVTQEQKTEFIRRLLFESYEDLGLLSPVEPENSAE